MTAGGDKVPDQCHCDGSDLQCPGSINNHNDDDDDDDNHDYDDDVTQLAHNTVNRSDKE